MKNLLHMLVLTVIPCSMPQVYLVQCPKCYLSFHQAKWQWDWILLTPLYLWKNKLRPLNHNIDGKTRSLLPQFSWSASLSTRTYVQLALHPKHTFLTWPQVAHEHHPQVKNFLLTDPLLRINIPLFCITHILVITLECLHKPAWLQGFVIPLIHFCIIMKHKERIDLNYSQKLFSTSAQEGLDISAKTNFKLGALISPPTSTSLS